MKRLIFVFLTTLLALPAVAWMPQSTPKPSVGDNDDEGVLPRQYADSVGGATVLPVGVYEIGILELNLPSGSTIHLFVPAAVADHFAQNATTPVGTSKPFTTPDGQSGVATWWKHPGETNLDFTARVALGQQFLEDLGGVVFGP